MLTEALSQRLHFPKVLFWNIAIVFTLKKLENHENTSWLIYFSQGGWSKYPRFVCCVSFSRQLKNGNFFQASCVSRIFRSALLKLRDERSAREDGEDGEVVAGSLSLDEWRWWIFRVDEKKRSNSKYIDEDAEYVVCVFLYLRILRWICVKGWCVRIAWFCWR